MKKRTLILIFSIISCNVKVEKKIVSDSKPHTTFDWLLGNWIRTNEKEDRKTYERWTKINPSEYSGTSFTLKDKDTIWQENVKLINDKNEWNFVVTPKGTPQQTVFRLTTLTDSTFTCENQNNDFPKIIRYFKSGDSFNAEIEGGDMKILFEFGKEIE